LKADENCANVFEKSNKNFRDGRLPEAEEFSTPNFERYRRTHTTRADDKPSDLLLDSFAKRLRQRRYHSLCMRPTTTSNDVRTSPSA